jgi:hypothetical protein
MVEYKDANEAERAVKLCNSGMMAVGSKDLFRWLDQVGNANAAGEYYLPDIVMIAKDEAARRWRSKASRSKPPASTAAPSWPIWSSIGSADAARKPWSWAPP